MTAGPRRVVALRALGLGDFLTGVPALRALRRAFPDHEVVLAAPAGLEPLVRLAGAAHRVVGTAPLAALDRALHHAVVAVNLHGRGPQSHRALLAAGPARLVAFAHPGVPETAGMPPWRPREHERRRWCRLLEGAGIPADADDLYLAPPPVEPLNGTAGATVVHPGAADAARRWPLGRWAVVARAERAAGRAVVVTGSAGERQLAENVAAAAGLPAGAVLAGRTSLLGLAATVAAAGRVLCGDTGVAHLATAYRRPSVVLFGPTPPGEWGPPPGGPHVALWAGKRGDPHGDRPFSGLLELGVEEVVAALERLPTSPPVMVTQRISGGR